MKLFVIINIGEAIEIKKIIKVFEIEEDSYFIIFY